MTEARESLDMAVERSTHKASFLMGIFAALSVVLILEGGVFIIWQWNANAPLMVSSDPRIDWTRLQERDADLLWAIKPNLWKARLTESVDPTEADWNVSTNDHGWRSPALTEKQERFRILALGDSTTFGLGVNDAEAWPAQLQEILDGSRAFIDVQNAGLPGCSAFQSLMFLLKRGFPVDPDLVLLTNGFNDTGLAPFSDIALKGSSQRSALERIVTEEEKKHSGVEAKKQKARLTPGEFVDTLLAIRRVCDLHGVGLLFICWPVMTPTSEIVHYENWIREVSRIANVPLIDLHEPFKRSQEPVYLPNDYVHANPHGCALAAQAAAEVIRSEMRKGRLGQAWMARELAVASESEKSGDFARAELIRSFLRDFEGEPAQ